MSTENTAGRWSELTSTRYRPVALTFSGSGSSRSTSMAWFRLRMSWRTLLLALTAGSGLIFAAEVEKTPTATPAPRTTATPPAASPTSAPESAKTAPTPAPARNDSSVAPTASFDTFRVVSDRNIFNPNRTGRRERSTEETPPRVDTLSVVGTMESDRGLRAFFDGSDASYRRAVRVGETVDKFKVTQITPQMVDLERDGKNLSVRVGQQLRRPEGADWDLVGEDVVRSEAQARAAAEARGDPSVPPPIPAGASDIERRMRERRQKDFKR
jgi:Tfp pilus assembly protein PilP